VHATRWDSTDYRRCARRLRHVHRSNPARLASSLKELSAAYDASTRPRPGRCESATAAPDSAARVQGSGLGVQDGDKETRWSSCATTFLVIQGLIIAGATYVVAS
jgi:hypothetical protein